MAALYVLPPLICKSRERSREAEFCDSAIVMKILITMFRNITSLNAETVLLNGDTKRYTNASQTSIT